MSNIIDGLIKGVSGFLPQDDPDVKILTAQAELREFSEKEEKIFARLGRAVYDTDGGESHPEIKTELEVLFNNRYAAEERLQAARDEKILREKAEAEERARREGSTQLSQLRKLQFAGNKLLPGMRHTPRSSGTSSRRQTLLSQLRSRSGCRLPLLQQLRHADRIIRIQTH